MKHYTLRKILWLLPLFLLTACPVPDVDEYAELTREMAEVIKIGSNDVIYFLSEGSPVTSTEDESDILLLEDLANLQGNTQQINVANYPRELKKNWRSIYRTLNALVAYSDALASIKESGAKGKESFNRLAGSLNNVLAVSGVSPVSESVTTVGAYLYSAIAQIRARNDLEAIISNADTVIQHVAVKLDIVLHQMEIINDVAKSKNLELSSDSKEAQQVKQLYESLIEKKKRNRVKIILLNDYENGDYESLKFFIYEDPVSLDKLGINDLTDQIEKINTTGGLTPRDKLEKITLLAKTTFKAAIENKLTNTNIVNAIHIEGRRVEIQQELNFIREELQWIAPEYHKNIEDQKQIEYIAGLNEQLILNSRNLIRSWSKYHDQMEHFFAKKQKLSLNELKLYINEMKALKKELDQQQR